MSAAVPGTAHELVPERNQMRTRKYATGYDRFLDIRVGLQTLQITVEHAPVFLVAEMQCVHAGLIFLKYDIMDVSECIDDTREEQRSHAGNGVNHAAYLIRCRRRQNSSVLPTCGTRVFPQPVE
jgi:hypothetical protein